MAKTTWDGFERCDVRAPAGSEVHPMVANGPDSGMVPADGVVVAHRAARTRHPAVAALGQLAAAYAALTLLFWGLGAIVVHWLDATSVTRFDDRVERWFAAHRTAGWNRASWWGSMLSETSTKIVVTTLVCVGLLAATRRWRWPLLVAVPLILEASVFLTTTLLVGRPRPDVVRLDSSPVDSSFPSGHVAAAACYGGMAVVVFLWTRRRAVRVVAVSAVVVVTAIVAAARLYRGMHHPTDVLAGVVLGILSVLVCTRIVLSATSPDAERRPVGASAADVPAVDVALATEGGRVR